MKCFLVLLLGGSSKRFGEPTPKQFLSLMGKPVWTYSLNCFLSALSDLRVVFVVSQDYQRPITEWLNQNHSGLKFGFALPGLERQDSVLSGLRSCDSDTELVFIHDGARPNPSQSLIMRLFHRCLESGYGVIPGLTITDSVKAVDNCNMIQGNVNRQILRLVQTPQVFLYQDILQAYVNHIGHPEGTDDSWFALKQGIAVEIVRGEESNFKLTVKEDFKRMQELMTEVCGEGSKT